MVETKIKTEYGVLTGIHHIFLIEFLCFGIRKFFAVMRFQLTVLCTRDSKNESVIEMNHKGTALPVSSPMRVRLV